MRREYFSLQQIFDVFSAGKMHVRGSTSCTLLHAHDCAYRAQRRSGFYNRPRSRRIRAREHRRCRQRAAPPPPRARPDEVPVNKEIMLTVTIHKSTVKKQWRSRMFNGWGSIQCWKCQRYVVDLVSVRYWLLLSLAAPFAGPVAPAQTLTSPLLDAKERL